MAGSIDFVSPKQVARALGVSESSMKRWCDQGLIRTVLTAGGHRKMSKADVLKFARSRGHAIISPELIGLPSGTGHAEICLKRGQRSIVDALLSGQEDVARQIVYDLYLAKHSVAKICDEVIARAFHEIGDRWACHSADVYQERRGCEIALRLLLDVRRTLPQTNSCWTAIGGTIEGDHYALPSIMVELVLRDLGIRATSLGNSIPWASWIKSVEETQPNVLWLSVSHICDGLTFLTEFAVLSRACQVAETALVVGGRALNNELRQQMTYSAFCDTMQHLEAFARTFLSQNSRNAKSKSSKGRQPVKKHPLKLKPDA